MAYRYTNSSGGKPDYFDYGRGREIDDDSDSYGRKPFSSMNSDRGTPSSQYMSQHQSVLHDPADSYGQDEEVANNEEVEGIKQEIRFTKQESLSATENAIRLAAQAEETGRNTLLTLGEQSEQLANAEKHIELAAVSAQSASDKADKLKRLNRSMFAINIGKPWGKKKRAEQQEEIIRARHEMERIKLDENRQFIYKSQQNVDDALKSKSGKSKHHGSNDSHPSNAHTSTSITERARYQFEPDEEDDEIEKEIDENLNTLGKAAQRLHGLAKATNLEINHQIQKIDQVQDTSDSLEMRMFMNTQRINRIK